MLAGRRRVRDKHPVPTGRLRLIAFVHPLVALASVAFFAWVAALGLRSRHRLEGHLRRRHARFARWAYGFMIVDFAGGLASARALRPDLDGLGSAHARLAAAAVVVMTAAAWLSRRTATDPMARLLHPVLGLLALVLLGLQVFFGMPLLPL